MKLSTLVTINAFIWLVMGIALSLYAPLALNLFGVPDIPSDDPLLYWNVAAFARLYGAALFGLGLLLWSLRSLISNVSDKDRRGVLFSLLITNVIGAFVAATQSVAFWQSVTGWVLCAVYVFLAIGYGFFLGKNF